MAYLQKLKLTKENKCVAVDDEKRRRNKLVEKIEEQKAIAEVGLSGTEYTATKKVWLTNDKGVQRASREAT